MAFYGPILQFDIIILQSNNLFNLEKNCEVSEIRIKHMAMLQIMKQH